MPQQSQRVIAEVTALTRVVREQRVNIEMNLVATDIDECRIMPFLCRNGRCRNTIGAFNCECADGYVLAQDGQHCRDIDECHEVGGSRVLKKENDVE